MAIEIAKEDQPRDRSHEPLVRTVGKIDQRGRKEVAIIAENIGLISSRRLQCRLALQQFSAY